METSPIGKVFATPTGFPEEVIATAQELGVATIAAGMADPWPRFHLFEQSLHRISGTGAIAGRAVTCWNPPGNNTMVRFAIEACAPGDVLVLTTPTDGTAQWGDLAHDWAAAVGLAGVIIDGSVRDVEGIRRVGLSLWARTVDPRQSLKQALGYVNAPIHTAGVSIDPGDLIVADDDGVLVVPHSEASEVVAKAKERADREELSRKDLVQGRVSPHLAAIFDADAIKLVGTTWTGGAVT